MNIYRFTQYYVHRTSDKHFLISQSLIFHTNGIEQLNSRNTGDSVHFFLSTPLYNLSLLLLLRHRQDAEVTAVLSHYNQGVPYIMWAFSAIFRLTYGKGASSVTIIYQRAVFRQASPLPLWFDSIRQAGVVFACLSH